MLALTFLNRHRRREAAAATTIQDAWKRKRALESGRLGGTPRDSKYDKLAAAAGKYKDADGDGKIDLEELAAALVHAGRAKKVDVLTHMKVLDWYSRSNVLKKMPFMRCVTHVLKTTVFANMNVALSGLFVFFLL